ncbi:MAG: trypsin-like peptidase domain-containing protein [Acidobacteria bacterium]|nr:trypsin-like peptidase domain-containing protein [Acidobacteriota bacterium]
MESRILVKHLHAAKSGQVEEFPVTQKRELTIGRDPSCDLKFDPNNDLVSRRHARITASPADPADYTIEDLGSRNGTFVNNQRIFGPVKLNCGDLIRLGPGGPEFEFDLTPRPASMVKPTRLADSPVVTPSTGVSPTREATPSVASPPTVGKATVERMIHETKAQGQKTMYWAVGAILVILAIVAGWLYFSRPESTVVVQKIEQKLSPSGLTPTQIAQQNTDATVLFEVGWKLVDTVTGKQLYHVSVSNIQSVKGEDGKQRESQLYPGAGDVMLPVFLVVDDEYEPLLSTDEKEGKNPSIGGNHSGSGFVVSNDGFILTNRHVAAAWHAKYDFPAVAGVVLVGNEKGKVQVKVISREEFPAWIPSQAKIVTSTSLNLATLRSLPAIVPRGKALEGRNDYLDVTFAKNRIRIPAKLARISDRNDVAMVKIDIPQTLKKVELNDNYDSIKVGDPVVVLGYPGFSQKVLGVVASRDILNQQISVKEIPDPTLSAGNIGRILRGHAGLTEAAVFAGDYYQLTINSTGGGNSGGPMFDDQGKVVGIYTLGIRDDANASGAVPIRYGIELMGVQPASR